MIRVRIITTGNQEIVNVSEEATIREILNENDISSVAGAVTSLDGCSLTTGDFDKTLPELGVEDSCVLSVIVKTANAARATIAGSSCIVTSDISLETLKTIKKYRPKALNLYEGEGKEKELVFSIDLSEKTGGNMNKYGATFGPHASADGKATLTLLIDPEETEPLKAVTEKIGPAMLLLNKLEATLGAVENDVAQEKEAISACFTVA